MSKPFNTLSRAFLLPVTSLLVVSSCLAPNYKAQYVNIADSWRVETNEESTLCNLSWWQQFQDPVLNDFIVAALKNNQDLHVAISRVLEYYARFRIVSAELYPQVDGTASFNRYQTTLELPIPIIPGQKRIYSIFDAFFSLSWELDFWGRIHSQSEAAYADLLSQVEARRAVVMTVVTSVVNAYITLRAFDGQLEISQKTLESRYQSLDLAENRFFLGETSELEVFQAKAEVEIAAIRLIELQRAIPQQENLLSVLLGENPRQIERGRTLNTFEYPALIPAGLPSDLLRRRPDIVEAEDRLIAANARVSGAQALYFPQISLTGQYGNQSDELHNLLTAPARMWQYGLSATQTIFDAGRIVYQVKEAKALRNEALFTYRQTVLNAFREVDDALIASKKNLELVAENQKQVKILKGYLHLAQLRYNEGEIDYLNVLDAERSLFDAELQLVQAQANNFSAVVDLYGALGGGWIMDADSFALNNSCCLE